MATKLSVSLSADIDVKQDAATCPTGTTDPGQAFKPALLAVNKQADIEQSNRLLPVDASGGAVSLPFPATLEGKFLYLRVLNNGGPIDVEVTHANQGATVYPVAGLLMIEVADDEYITGVRVVAGTATIEWLVTGAEA